MTWMLLAWWCSKGLARWERGNRAVFYDVYRGRHHGMGEHYLIDLIVAFPFALMIQTLCAYSVPWRDEGRRRPFLFGLLATMAWLLCFALNPACFGSRRLFRGQRVFSPWCCRLFRLSGLRGSHQQECLLLLAKPQLSALPSRYSQKPS